MSRNLNLVEVPTKALLGPALAWVVADAMGYGVRDELRIGTFCKKPGLLPLFTRKYDYRWPLIRGWKFDPLDPKTPHGHLILRLMEQCGISVVNFCDGRGWRASISDGKEPDPQFVSGTTPGIAVLRRYAIHVFGDFAHVPNEFI